MSEQNVEIVMRFLDAYSLGASIERGLAVCAPDALLHPFPDWIEDSEYRGEDGVRRLSAVWTDTFDDFAIQLGEIRDLGDRVILLGETTGKVKATGVRISQPVGAVFSNFHEGRIGEAHFFDKWEEALKAVGIED
jgi:ketosteroid isomerase-like protein